jgi:cell wall-associated NlpC family hydrolase
MRSATGSRVWKAASVAILALLVLASQADAAKSRKKAKGSKKAKVERTLASKTVTARKIPRTGNAELDRLLEERPAPESWTDSVLSTPAQAVALEKSHQRDSVPWSGYTPLERIRSISDPLIGSPYRSGGNGERGFDCSGFVLAVTKAFGITLKGRSSPSYWTLGESVEESELQAGDLVFFSDHTRRIGHVGIYLENGRFVHASVQSGVIESAIEEKYYRRRYKGARRIPELVEALQGKPGSVASR